MIISQISLARTIICNLQNSQATENGKMSRNQGMLQRQTFRKIALLRMNNKIIKFEYLPSDAQNCNDPQCLISSAHPR